MKKFFLITVMFFVFMGGLHAQEQPKGKDWGAWVGRKVNVNYDCCGLGTCKLIMNAPLKEVTDKSIVVMTNGAPFLIPRYMIKALTLSK